jgi:3'5'-cyclic nucleotide phosphodiesterase
MGVVKLLSRIVAPDIEEIGNKTLEDHTYGINADPLTRFAVVFSALIHDVDHPGVSNMQLVKEGTRLSALYHNQSVAEQNSVDIAWHLLMDSKYENLRYTIYTTEAEFRRFRSLIVNAVMATDIMDKDLKKLRNDRWEVAFDVQKDQVSREAANRKATIVIEHLIQASDVAHTMQHWHVYRKWNERLFQEMYKAYETGRLESDPSATWYEGEMGFFDFYIIPLAKKLKDCGVFGVSSDEYLSYAIQNRKEWEQRGKTLVEEMANAVKSKQ